MSGRGFAMNTDEAGTRTTRLMLVMVMDEDERQIVNSFPLCSNVQARGRESPILWRRRLDPVG